MKRVASRPARGLRVAVVGGAVGPDQPPGRGRWRLRRPVLALIPLLVLGVVPGAPCGTGDDEPVAQAARLLERMTTALGTLNYQGTLVYLIENRLETLHVVHRVVQGRVTERLVSLSGPPRELARDPDRVTWVIPGGHPISVGPQPPRGGSAMPAIDPARLTERYAIAMLGAARVAGRDADVLLIRPRDALRYGYQFHLDRATGLPLKSDLIDGQGAAIEQLLFTSIDLDRAGVQSAFESPAGVARPPVASAAMLATADRPPDATRWRFAGVPGFELALHDLTPDARGAPVDHFVFSDRLSSYSVFIEGDTADGLHGDTRIGAVHAAGRVVDGHQVTAVGEVPAATVTAAVMGVSRVAAP